MIGGIGELFRKVERTPAPLSAVQAPERAASNVTGGRVSGGRIALP